MGEEHKHTHSRTHGHGHADFPKGAEDVFFFEDSIAPGIVLTTRILSTRSSPIFLHRDTNDHIPFSMKNLTDILAMFPRASRTMADDIVATLQMCEHPEMVHGEKAGCAASIESFLELVVSLLGTHDVRALSPEAPMEGVPSVRYTVASATPLTTSSSETVLVCHDMPYPYKVFFCHAATPVRAYRMSLVVAGDGRRRPAAMDALAVCHLNTSHWSPDHPFFRLKHVKPGQTTACHFLARGNIMWLPAEKEAAQ
ncbi:BURP domain-containing protein 9-like [Oryza brachyantha]|nr:BURP domain-containing protein 9-like [Oryza brachyantha]